MSLPSSEQLPNDIHDLPPARQRHLRRMPRAASPAEWEILLESLLELTRPNLAFFLLALLGAASSGAALYFNEPAGLVLALVLLPFLSPIFNLALLPARMKFGPALKALIGLLVPIVLSIGVGILVGWFAPEASFSKLAFTDFTTPNWINLALVAGSAIFSTAILIREDRLPHLVGAILSYEILLPLTLAGFSFITGAATWPGTLLTALTHLGLALTAATLAMIMIGFAPKALSGWALSLVPIIFTLITLIAALLLAGRISLPWLPDLDVPTQSAETQSATEKAPEVTETLAAPTETAFVPSATLQPSITPSPTLAATVTPSATPTATPTVMIGIIISESGAVVREEPSTNSLVVSYVNDGDVVMLLGEYQSGNALWYQVQTELGETGWMLSTLIQTPTPTPSPTAD